MTSESTSPTDLTPHTYVRQTLRDLWENLPGILLGGLCFSLLGAPTFVLAVLGFFAPALLLGVVLMAPGWVMLLAWEAKLAQGQMTTWRWVAQRFAQVWVRAVRLGLLFTVPMIIMRLTIFWVIAHDAGMLQEISLMAGAASIVLVMALLACYAFPRLALATGDIDTILAHSLTLVSSNLVATFGLLSLGILMGFGVVYLSPGLLLILPALYGFFIVNHYRLVIGIATLDADWG